MIKATSENGINSVSMNGSLAELTSDALGIVHAIYGGFKKENDGSAEKFKKAFIKAIEDDKVFYDDDKRDEVLACASGDKEIAKLLKGLQEILKKYED